MFTGVWTILAGAKRIAELEADAAYIQLLKIFGILLALVLLQLGTNVWFHPGVNYFFFFFGGIFTLCMLFVPIWQERAAGGGFVYTGLNDTDMSQGVLAGLGWWFKAVVTLVFSWWVISGFLSTWSFRENPGAFFPVAAGACILTSMTVVFGWKSHVFKWVVAGYACVVIVVALLATIPGTNLKTTLNQNSFSASASSAGRQPATERVNAPRIVIAPVGQWSEEVMVPSGKCFSWDGASTSDMSFLAHVFDSETKVWTPHGGGKRAKDFKAIRFKSETSKPMNITLSEKDYGRC